MYNNNNQQYFHQQHQDGAMMNLAPAAGQMSASSRARSQIDSVDELAYHGEIQEQAGYPYDANTQRSLNSVRNTYTTQPMMDRASTNRTDQMNSGRAGGRGGGENLGSQRAAPAGIHQSIGQSEPQQQFQRPPLGAHPAQGRIPNDALRPKYADPMTSFNEENDVYDISSLFDDVKNSQDYATYQGIRRDTDPGDEAILDFQRANDRDVHGNVGASRDFSAAGVHFMNANSNFMSDREDFQNNQLMANAMSQNQYHPADTFNARAASSFEGSVREPQQDQFMDAMESELNNLEHISQQNQLRTEAKAPYDQSQYNQSQRLHQAQNSQSKEALFQTPKPGMGDPRRASDTAFRPYQMNEAASQGFMGGGQSQRESQMTYQSVQKADLFNDQMQRAMTQADGQNYEGKHARGPTNGSMSTANGGVGGQLFDTPSERYNFNDRQSELNQQRQSQAQNLKLGGQRPFALDKDEENAMIDWINSFDDPFLVLVSRLPQDLLNGVVLSHLVGYIACTADDRDKIFELLNYPKDHNGAMMGLQGDVQPDEVRENFDLAYNVLQYSQAYQELGEEQRFLEQELAGGERISPESMAAGNIAHILLFLEGVQSLNFTLRQSRLHPNNLPPQNQTGGATSGEAASLDQIPGKLTSSLPTNQDRYRPVSDLSQAPGKISPMDLNARILLASEGSKLQEHSDLKQALSAGGLEPQAEGASGIRPVPGAITEEANGNQAPNRTARNPTQGKLSEFDELKRLEQEEMKLMDEINKVDQVVSVMREDYEKIRLDQLNADLVLNKRPRSGRTSPGTGSMAGSQAQAIRPSNLPPRAMSSMGEASPDFAAQNSNRRSSAARNHQNMQSTAKSRSGVPVARFRANSYRENSAKRLLAWHNSMSRPLKHQHRRSSIQRKLLENMDYAHVIRKSYSRPQNSRTTDQLVIEETGMSMTNSGEQSSKLPENPRNDPTQFVSTLVKSVNLPVQQPRPQAQNHQAGESGQRRSVDFAVGTEQFYGQNIPQGTFGLKGVSGHSNANDQPRPKQYQQHNYQRLPTMDDLQKPPRPAGQQKHNYQKIVHEKRNIQVVKHERNFASFAAPQNEQCLDEIMSEMQTLNVRPSTISSAQGTLDNRGHQENINVLEADTTQIIQVDEQLKVKILDWLTNDVRLLKPMTEKQKEGLVRTFPQYSRTGVIFADLINRLNGRNEVIKGVYRNPPKGNSSQIQANFTKVMNYFKQFPRFCPRYLWSTQDMIQGNEDVIWGFFDDIWHWNFKKISPYDPAYRKEQAQVPPSTAAKQPRTQGSSLERPVPQSQRRFHSSRHRELEPIDRRGQDVQPQHQSTVPFQHRNPENQPANRPPIKRVKPPNFDKNQVQLLQPRSILPQNMVFEKRPQSAKNSHALLGGPAGRKGSTLQDPQFGFQSLVASARHNLAKNSIRRGHSSQAFSERQLSMSEKRVANPHIQKGHEYSQKVKTRNSNILKRHHATASGGEHSAKRSYSPKKREQRQKSSVGFDFSNQQQDMKKGIEPLFNESTGSFEQELNQFNAGKPAHKKSYDLPLQKSPQTISPILKNKGKRQQHKFEATAKSNNNRDLETIAGLFQDDEDGFDQYRVEKPDPPQKRAAREQFDNQVVYKSKGKGFKIMNQFDIFPSGSEKEETNELMLSWNRRLNKEGGDAGNAGSRRGSPGDASDAGVLGLLGPQQPIGYEYLEK